MIAPTREARECTYEIWDILRVADAAAVDRRRRADALSERARPGGARRPARLRLRLGGGAPFPRGIFAFAGARGVSRRGLAAHQEYPPCAWDHAAHHDPSGALRRAYRRARSGKPRPG